MSFWIVCYPCGDQSKLSVAEICFGMEYELTDYSLASRKQFDSEEEAEEYARTLAQKHNKELKGVTNYLD